MGSVDVMFPLEPYKCALPPDSIELAQKELREDDEIREQALEKMRDWIKKNPAIKRCRMDSKFLLRFLRTKKFSIPQACTLLEKYLINRQMFPNFFQKLDIEDPKIRDIFETGYICVLPKRDNKNRRTILFRLSQLDPNKHSRDDITKFHSLIVEHLLDDELNQIHGYVTINDFQNITPAHLSIWSLSELRFLVNCVQNVSPMRYKQFHLFNMPSILKQIVDFIMSIFNEKMKSRIKVHKSTEDFKENFEVNVIPKEYGGDIPLSNMIADLKKELLAKRETILALDDMQIDLDMCSNLELASGGEHDLGTSGSFRKLNID